MAAGHREAPSPYEATIGDDLAGLHPRLQAYFGAIPPGHHGFGRGVFDTVGTPRRWLWPALAAMAGPGVAFPVWERDVPFTVVNRPVVAASGHPAVAAVRTFELAGGDRRMVDEIAASGRGLVDRLGSPCRLEAVLRATVTDGALTLVSTAVTFRMGRAGIRLPAFLSPRVALTERFDDASDAQHVSIVVSAPLVGTIYQYAGSFTYEIRPGEPSGGGSGS